MNPDTVKTDQLLPLLKPFPDDKMEEWEVGVEARNPRNDYPGLLSHLKPAGKKAYFINFLALSSLRGIEISGSECSWKILFLVDDSTLTLIELLWKHITKYKTFRTYAHGVYANLKSY